ncbi:fasciclin domain-containing protein [Dyadobacter sp. CY261]|uniref:fasciclin domain-containing protein n=1 Tax=Dyadobacter sp. CY261 TaxID=2907203 RepID=UPI001F411293|nr:fasciclin domain-containing protein [Dyadobacter sp. CY261]MCF0072018.1 fasciclin domain-containing protein [Dyadobacter sp. CY261]
MKKNRFGGRWATFFLAAGLFSTILVSCKEDDDDVVKRKAMTDVIMENPEFSMLKDIMERAGKSDDFRSQNLTLLAPSNAAFNKANIFSSSVIADKDARDFINNHTVKSIKKYSDFAAGTLEVVGPLKITVAKKDSVVTFNGAKINRKDVETNNGYIQVLDSVYVKVI